MSRFLSKLKLRFLVAAITANIHREAIKNLKNTNEKGVIYCRPIFIEGNEVPHKKPAKTVNRIAFFSVSAPTCFRKGFAFLFNSSIGMFLRLSHKTQLTRNLIVLQIILNASRNIRFHD